MLDAKLFKIIQDLVAETNDGKLKIKLIWENVRNSVGGFASGPLSHEEFGTPSQKGINDILKDKFGAEPIRIGNEVDRGLKFNKDTLSRLAPNYANSREIVITKHADATAAVIPFLERASAKTDLSDPSLYNNNPEKIDRVEHEMVGNDLSNPSNSLSDSSKNRGQTVSKASELSALSANHEHSIHRVREGSDTWYCDYCNVRCDRHFFARTTCPRNKKV